MKVSGFYDYFLNEFFFSREDFNTENGSKAEICTNDLGRVASWQLITTSILRQFLLEVHIIL